MLLSIEAAIALGALWGIMAIGVFITYKIMKISDLTVDGSFATGACVSVALILMDMNPLVTVFVAVVVGALSGVITGLLQTRGEIPAVLGVMVVTMLILSDKHILVKIIVPIVVGLILGALMYLLKIKLQVPAILSGILTMISLYSINLRIMGKGNVAIMKNTTIFTYMEELTKLSRNRVTLVVGLGFVIVIIAMLYWFFGTEIGCALRATGNNEAMAKALGVNTDNIKILGLAVSNGLVALSGALVGQYQRYGDVTMGTGTIVIGLASVVIGGVIISGKGNFALKLFGTMLGSVIYRVLIALVLEFGLKAYDQKLLTAIMVVMAIAISKVTDQIRSYSKKGGE